MDATPDTVGLVITGFGPFGEVGDNPTALLAKRLAEELSSAAETREMEGSASGLGRLYRLLGHKVLEVAAQDVDQWVETELRPCLDAQCALPAQPQTPSSPGQAQPAVLILHLGVAMSATRLRLEQCCYNEASFRIPDRRGWQPQRPQCIDESAPLSSCLRLTSLDMEAAARQLTSDPLNLPVELSDNPGRFLCNWVYYRSQRIAQSLSGGVTGRRVHALFVHVPLFNTVDEDTQRRFLTALLQILHEQMTAPRQAAATVTGGGHSLSTLEAPVCLQHPHSLTPPPIP